MKETGFLVLEGGLIVLTSGLETRAKETRFLSTGEEYLAPCFAPTGRSFAPNSPLPLSLTSVI